jgi:hypothetical protein
VDPSRAVGKWTQSSVYEILHNPKYTGYMVWNRRAMKTGRGKVNPVSDWVWSSQPTHDALVSWETFLQAWGIAGHRERSRGATPSKHPQAKREYRLRTYLFCAACGRRMFGKTRRDHAYYACAPAGTAPDGHPASFWGARTAFAGRGKPVLQPGCIRPRPARPTGPAASRCRHPRAHRPRGQHRRTAQDTGRHRQAPRTAHARPGNHR